MNNPTATMQIDSRPTGTAGAEFAAPSGSPFFSDDAVTLYNADCRDLLPQIRGVDCVVTDPPYFLPAAHYSENANPGEEAERRR